MSFTNHKITDTVIIGAGASGLVCAISAKRKNASADVILLESRDRVGKKILSTGNGKCNLSNTNTDIENCYHSSNSGFVKKVTDKFGFERNIEFFSSIGLVCRTDSEGRVYPFSQHASSVLDALRRECDRLCIKTLLNVKIQNAVKENGLFKITYNENITLLCKNLVIATGGMSYSKENSLTGYDILKSFGHKIINVYPSLVPLKAENPNKSLKGIRSPAVASLFIGNKKIKSEYGEIQFTDYGLSGIAIMQLSAFAAKALQNDKKENCVISLDLMPRYSENDITEILLQNAQRYGETQSLNLLSGIFHKMLSAAIVKSALKNNAQERLAELKKNQIEAVAKAVKDFRFTITDTMGFPSAQVTGAGADLEEFYSETLESKLVSGLYAAGEILDVTGICGGFNLNWAWSSGRLCGESASERTMKK